MINSATTQKQTDNKWKTNASLLPVKDILKTGSFRCQFCSAKLISYRICSPILQHGPTSHQLIKLHT